MFTALSELNPYLTYATPPLLGAFIGYLTNRVAIRMLFRPLKRWKIGPIPVPMTPGVIPSKRHELALNIGEMVGEHLLTSEEINSALKKDAFQEHLYSLIESKVGSFLKKDLGPLSSIIHPSYKSYFDIGHKTVTYQIKETVQNYLHSQGCQDILELAIDSWVESLLDREVDDILPEELRTTLYTFLESSIQQVVKSPAFEEALTGFVNQQITNMHEKDNTLDDIIPESIRDLILGTIRSQTPLLLDKAAQILRDPDVRERLVETIQNGIEEFIESLGPMASMVRGFLNMEMIEEKVRDYLVDNEDEISALIKSQDVEIRVAAALTERGAVLFETPLADLTSELSEEEANRYGTEISQQIITLLNNHDATHTISHVCRSHIELFVDNGSRQMGGVAKDILGQQGITTFRSWLKQEMISLLKSKQTRLILDQMIEHMSENLVSKPIGRLDHIIPAGVREGLYRSLQEMATNMLTSEVPGVVKSINIRKIVSDKIDSFDLLRLELLLLSIMEEQFKYINLFGGLLGFLIGCANLFVIVGLQ